MDLVTTSPARLPEDDAVEPAVMLERDRIASELTARLVHRMYAVGLTLQRASQRVEDPEVRAMFATAVAELDQAIAEIRKIVFDVPTATANWAEEGRSRGA
ncbi:MAG: hypothetical protein GEV07_03790 [Streptosporangiales bacterium]|nr:hypothetical protein [Streptosporangiales bacterium]